MTQTPLVTVLIPARNEVDDIGRCLEHVIAQDYPLDRIEVVLVDGDSSDGTAEVAEKVLQGVDYLRWRILQNTNATTPSNLNHGLAIAQGEIICRVDARSLIPPNYVLTCVEVLNGRPDVAVVGGAQVAVAPTNNAMGAGIARALNNRYAMGLSRYRRGAKSGPTDTVYLGSFRTTRVRGEHGWDERMLTNQDFELNRRLARDGLVWFDDRLAVGYVPRRDLGSLFRQYHRFGCWKVKYWRETGDRPRPRQCLLLSSPLLALAAGAVLTRRLGTARTAATALLGAALVEQAGSDDRVRPALLSRATSVAALACVASGWLAGIGSESFTRQ